MKARNGSKPLRLWIGRAVIRCVHIYQNVHSCCRITSQPRSDDFGLEWYLWVRWTVLLQCSVRSSESVHTVEILQTLAVPSILMGIQLPSTDLQSQSSIAYKGIASYER